ncbi:helix-turn-helix domain-containing protein [Atopobacter phocae]|uniref:helix-turn-helix domain-containing protein n=1 Tax=Atopobacter phocae TaxID=136492 RepID=UPI00046E7F23|nr:helix-turn-helix domain-containing protein [Atopobacter phocae]
MQWSIIIVLLIFAIISFIISLIIPASKTNDADVKNLNDELLKQSRENYQLKRQIQELEDQLNPRHSLTNEEIYPTNELDHSYEKDNTEYLDYDSDESFSTSSLSNDYDDYDSYGKKSDEMGYQFYPEEEESTIESSYDFFNSTLSNKETIISLYNQGEALEDIAHELNVPVSTVQLVIDSYLEEQSLR